MYELRITKTGGDYTLVATDSVIIDGKWEYPSYGDLCKGLLQLHFESEELNALHTRLATMSQITLSNHRFRGSVLAEALGNPTD
jgi:hypothetical protein